MAIAPGQRLSHYRLLERVGEGGMGVVYRAFDEHLEREVAVKVLAPGKVVDETSRERFRTEALALSRLSHPAIETVHDFDSVEEIDFLVVEYIPGHTLASTLAAGPLPEDEILELAAQLVAGLGALHEQGILHRDLKPGNLRVTPDGRLKILDFGLAKLLATSGSDPTAETLAATSAVIGTPPYMAPEQLRGEYLDERTDLFAAGTVLYEMATGRAPHGGTGAVLVDAILHDEPVPPRALNPRISPGLERVVLKCLDKNPGHRYQTATEMAVDIDRLAAPTTGARARAPRPATVRRRPRLAAAAVVVAVAVAVGVGWLVRLREQPAAHPAMVHIESLAVLPLANLMGDPQQQYFVDGMHEALIANLARVEDLRVISRTSVMQYRESTESLPAIARELGVDAIVEGSVLKAQERVRITAQLVDAASDSHLWAETYESDLRDILRLQSETAQAIAREIRGVVSRADDVAAAGEGPVDLAAYEAYLKGRYYLNQRTEPEVFRSIEYFRESIAADPTFTLAQAALAEASILTGWYSWVPPQDAFVVAERAAESALTLDSESAEAHTVAAAVHLLWDWDWPAAEAEFRRAIELNPGYSRAHHWYALYLTYMRRYEEAITEIQRAQELDPLSIIIHTIAGLTFCQAGRYDDAIREAEKTLEMNPDFPLALGVAACGYMGTGQTAQALAAGRKAAEVTRGAVEIADLAVTYAAVGERQLALDLLAELEAKAESEYIAPMAFARIQLALGREDAALDWLERAYDERAWNLLFLGGGSYEPLRRYPRFQELLRRVDPPMPQ